MMLRPAFGRPWRHANIGDLRTEASASAWSGRST